MGQRVGNGALTHLGLANPNNGVLQEVGQDWSNNRVQRPWGEIHECQRPVTYGVGCGALVGHGAEELLHRALVPFIQRSRWIVHLLLGPRGELAVGIILGPMVTKKLEAFS